MREKGERNHYLDFVKGVAIILVVFGHSLQYGSGKVFFTEELYWENLIMKSIYSLHMPLFVVISGYLYYFSVKHHGEVESALIRVKQLFPVCGVWGILLWIARGIQNGKWGAKVLARLIVTDFWFLWTIIIAAVTVSTIERFFKKKLYMQILAYGIVLAIALFSPDDYWFNAHKFMFFFFVSGFYYAKFKHYWLQKRGVMLASLVAWIVMLQAYKSESYIYVSGFTLLQKENPAHQLSIDIYRFVIGAAGVIMVLSILRWIYNRIQCKQKMSFLVVAKKWLEMIGEQSLSIYILSSYLFIYLLPRLTSQVELNYLITLVESILILVFCYILEILLQKSECISRLILGVVNKSKEEE